MQSKVWPLETTVSSQSDRHADAVDVLLWIINHYFFYIPWREHSGQATSKMSSMTISMRHMSS